MVILRLITPHGDRKRQPGQRLRLPVQRLITPHGDRKPSRRRRLRRRPRPHYPSWGSKTRRRFWRKSTASRSHYPSWGSKTIAGTRFRPCRRPAHYPSWGSKTGASLFFARRPANSLPLMGIENQAAPVAPAGRAHLITPHGDRKRPARSPTTTSSISHYPSWGSKTRPCGSFAGSTPSLITPHGDRKPSDIVTFTDTEEGSLPLMGIENGRARCGGRSAPLGSLPLMGIENRRSCSRRQRCRLTSLPLMGIENRSTRCCERAGFSTHYPSWGSKTVVAAVAALPCDRLITPHGDRKLRRADRQRRPRDRAHYPSWGSKTADADILCGECWISLPLMGIENLRRRAAPWRPDRPHYPSWGSKTRRRRLPVRCLRSAHYPSWGSKT